ncbi:TPA: heavy metal transporter [Escherichia coli]|uniref:single-stranded DNA-binding protein n=1 Tax=Escherichia coli TaxID=562 RepID=UPI00176963EE|nr:single-stranded DNA-binding protein [Escherichia coli]QWV28155.1 G5P family DNA-binding protein [Escherichia coli]QWV28164.1 G5P family DNA-binding protein [Escherichia coli]HAG9930954.1 heavy metal transporter [Escherichia coli]HCS6843097.1 heavy metal transporter [Escherichia coli]
MAIINIDERYLVIIEFEEDDVRVDSFEYDKKDKKTGQLVLDSNGSPVKGVMYSQVGVVKLGRQVIECKVPLEEGQPPYSAGKYLIHPSSYTIGNFGSIEFAFKLVLFPLNDVRSKS